MPTAAIMLTVRIHPPITSELAHPQPATAQHKHEHKHEASGQQPSCVRFVKITLSIVWHAAPLRVPFRRDVSLSDVLIVSVAGWMVAVQTDCRERLRQLL
jgi:hypothetical protein